MQPTDRAGDCGRIPDRGFEQHIGGVSVDLGATRAHHAADRGDGHIVDDQDVRGFELAFDVIQGDDRLPLRGESHREIALNTTAVMCVHGVTEFEHDVVRDIDGRRDRSDTAEHESTTQPPGRHRGRVDTGHLAQGESADAGSGLDRHRQRVTLGGQDRHHVRVEGGVDEFQVVGTGDLAGDPAHRQPVAAVGRDGEVEHHIVETQHGGRILAGFSGPGRQHQDAGMIRAHAEFGSRADHAVGGVAVGLTGGDLEVTRQRGTG